MFKYVILMCGIPSNMKGADDWRKPTYLSGDHTADRDFGHVSPGRADPTYRHDLFAFWSS